MTEPPSAPPSAHDSGDGDAHLDDEALSAYFDAEADQELRTAAARHLETCPSCRERLASLSRAAEVVGQPVVSVPAATRQRQLDLALDVAAVRQLPNPVQRSRRLMVTSWAAALIIIAGAGVAIWRVHPNFGGGSSATATTVSGGSAMPGHSTHGGPATASAPALQLRLLGQRPYAGCVPPSALAQAPPASAVTLYDAPASASAEANRCAQLDAPLATLTGVTSARVVKSGAAPSASLILSVPVSSARLARSLLLQHAGSTFAVVVHDEVVGYLSTMQVAGLTVRIVEVPVGLARELASEFDAR
ncbi:MAG TPA: zf-HC2 domain-containing protein [Acidimicrobiales bacterium]|nr:zf-HC2 domain-containing protein [Acidimicrobiales bacterium]